MTDVKNLIDQPASLGSQPNFADRLITEIQLKKTPLIVGIDPRLEQLPPALQEAYTDRLSRLEQPQEAAAWAFEEFSRGIIDAVAELVPAIKPQMAFFEALGPAGMLALARVVDAAQSKGLMVLMDGKRNDIGTTAAAYAAAYLGKKPHSSWGCDALTVNPWMGYDTLEPFTQRAVAVGAGLFVLVKTSNPGSRDLQETKIGGGSLFEMIADHVEGLSAVTRGEFGFGVVGAVVGATYPDQLAELRQRMPHTLFLVPGFGAQGGTAADVAGAFDDRGFGAVINSSRGIIFAHEQQKYLDLARQDWRLGIEQATRDAIDLLATETSAGKLRQ